jgi:undecaprenyl-diphosphatase
MTVVSRFRDDDDPPALKDAARDLVVRAVVPAIGLILAGLAVGWLVVVPLASSTGEDQLNLVLRAGRTPTLDMVARIASEIGGVMGNAVLCVLAVVIIWFASRRWWLAALPFVALQLHIFVHIVTSTLVGRQRPDVEPLDVGQPTSSFPSGHMGATTAQLLVVVLFVCNRVESVVVRVVVIVTTGGYLLVLGWSRLYLGMHHLSDVVWGALNGVVCGLIAWLFLRRNPAQPVGQGTDDDLAEPGPGTPALAPSSGASPLGPAERVEAVSGEAEGDQGQQRLSHRQLGDVVQRPVETP